MKTVVTVITFTIIFGSLGVLSLFLLLRTHYFSIRELPGVHFGLTGAEISNTFESYKLLIEDCSESHKLREYCDNLPSFDKGGLVLKVILAIDISVLLLFILNIILSRLMIKKLIADTLQGLQTNHLCLSRVQFLLRNLVFIHPFLILGGAVAWVSVCDLGHIPGHVNIEEGLIVLLANAFTSLLVAACYFHFLKKTRKANRKLITRQFKQVI